MFMLPDSSHTKMAEDCLVLHWICDLSSRLTYLDITWPCSFVVYSVHSIALMVKSHMGHMQLSLLRSVWASYATDTKTTNWSTVRTGHHRAGEWLACIVLYCLVWIRKSNGFLIESTHDWNYCQLPTAKLKQQVLHTGPEHAAAIFC